MILTRLLMNKLAERNAERHSELDSESIDLRDPDFRQDDGRELGHVDVRGRGQVDGRKIQVLPDTPVERSPAVEVAKDIARRGAIGLPFVALISLLVGGTSAALAVILGVSIIIANFLGSGYLMAWAARHSQAMLASVSVGGYFARSFVIAAVVWLLKDVDSVNLMWLIFSLVISHLGLLFWELRYVSSTIAYPGLKPSALGYQPAAGYQKEGVA